MNDKLFVDVFEENANRPLPIRRELNPAFLGGTTYALGSFEDSVAQADQHLFPVPYAEYSTRDDLCVDGKFIARDAGLYSLNISHSIASSNAMLMSTIIYHSQDDSIEKAVAHALNCEVGNIVMPVQTVVYMQSGDYLVYRLISTNDQSHIRGSDRHLDFTFAKVG